jgi:putative ABC transport system permease protein
MPDFRAYIREHLPPLGVSGAQQADIVEEIAIEFEERYERALRGGMTPEEAWAVVQKDPEAWRELSNELRAIFGEDRSRSPQTGKASMFSSLFSHVQFSLRMLRKNPVFACSVILAVALGIGPNTAIFSVIYGVLWAPPEWPEPEKVVVLWSKINGHQRYSTSPLDYLDWKREAKSFAFMGASAQASFILGDSSREPEEIQAQKFSPGRITGMKATLLLGRDILPEDAIAGQDHVVLLSNRFWRERFGSDPKVIGKQLRLDQKPFTIIGVLRPGSTDRRQEQLWVPLAFGADDLSKRESRYLTIMARLKPGVSLRQAQAEMSAIAQRLAKSYPQTNKDWGTSVEPAKNDWLEPRTVRDLWLLMGAVTLVLLISCLNVANLLVARGAERRRELAVRASVGASRGQLFGQLVMESLLIAVLGGALGLSFAWMILKGFVAAVPAYWLQPENEIKLSFPVLLFTLATTLVCGLFFGCAPGWQMARVDLNASLKRGGQAGIGGGGRQLGRLLIVGEFALALTLLAGAGVAIHSFWNHTHLDLGIRTEHVLTFDLPVNVKHLGEGEQATKFYKQVVERIEAVPGVYRASAVLGLPLWGEIRLPFQIVGAPPADRNHPLVTQIRLVTPGFFDTFGVRVLRGRRFTEGDRANGPRVVMLNEKLAAGFFKGRDPLRQSLLVSQFSVGIRQPLPPVEWQVVGVFRDIENGQKFGGENMAEILAPFDQFPWPTPTVAVRTASDPEHIRRSISAAIQTLDPNMPLTNVKTMDQIVGIGLAGERFDALLYGSVSALALLLAGVGIYGVMAFVVSQRTREIGLRVALGAGKLTIIQSVLWEGMKVAIAGLILGLGGAYLSGRVLRATLFDTGAMDLPALLVVGLVLLAAALLACFIPATRAATVDPAVVLRSE